MIRNGVCTISSAICCRDDIMIYLIHKGLEPGTAFNIMENVRKGKVAKGACDKWESWKQEMRAHDVPDWYIASCEKIMYMFPKAHAAAYVMMAWRIAYCKLYYPLEYYAAFFSIRSDNFSYELMCQGKDALETVMQQLLGKEQLSKKEQDMLKDMRTVQEMYARGFEFLPIDIFKANVSKFTIIDGKIMPALTSITGLGEKAAQSMADAIQSGEISCVADLEVKTLVGQKMLIELDRLGIFHDLPKSNQLSMFDTLF